MADTANWTGSRLLLSRMRDVMAGDGDAQRRLDQIVRIVARDMVAEVCSIYLLRPGDILELYATEGLLKTAVHRTRLRVGEGLVGDVAAQALSVALADAQTHPHFAYRPETGEEVYHSFLGVPIMRGGRVRGVLVVQNQTRRNYTDEEVETLETVAMVLAELIASGAVAPPAELTPADGIAVKPLRLEGARMNGGLAMGTATIHERRSTISRVVAEDMEEELERFETAVRVMHESLEELSQSMGGRQGGGEHIEVFAAYRMFAEDRGWLTRIGEAIRGGLTADAAVAKVLNDTRARMAQAADPYLRERMLDIEDLAYRLLRHLDDARDTDPPRPPAGDGEIVLVARSLGPAELLDYHRTGLVALVLEEGSATEHVAIVARALGIPVVGHVAGALNRIEAGDTVLVDADNGIVVVRPGDDVQQAFAEAMAARAEKQAVWAASRDLPAVTRDGVPISLNLNAGVLLDLPYLAASGADGIGLYRTEMLFMMHDAMPGVEEQTRLYRGVLDQAAGRPVVFRTLDVGGDKLLPYMQGGAERNPAMGWRAIRIGLDRPSMLRKQIRALIRAASGGPLSIMFPMVTQAAELDAARRLLDKEIERARAHSQAVPEALSVGCMVEVPSLLFQLPRILERVDFLAIGSNDLLQFLFASDRGNIAVSKRYDVLSPPVLTMLRSLARQCEESHVPVSLCGEMAGEPLAAMALIGAGFRSLSMAAPAIGPVRLMVRSLKIAQFAEYMDSLLDSSAASLRTGLRAYARDHGIVL